MFAVVYDRRDAPDGCGWIDAHLLDSMLPKKPQGFVGSTMCFAKLFLPALEPLKQFKRVVYVDNDFEIVSHHFLDLLDESMDGAEVLAARESNAMQRCHSKKWKHSGLKDMAALMPSCAKARLDSGEYFNSGLLVLDLEQLHASHPHYLEDMSAMVA